MILTVLSAVALAAAPVTAPVTATASPANAPGIPPSLVAVDPSFGQPASDPFYTPPDTIPATPGAIIRSRSTPHLLHPGQEGATAGKADRLLYTSTTGDGTPVATSGFVIEPVGTWTGAGPTPTIVFAPGTRGTGDACAPSRATDLLAGGDPGSGTVNLSYEYPVYAMASAQGYRVIVTDYIGLGTPGQHSYVNHTEEAHAVLDAARAGLHFAGAPEDSPVALFGYSQGGGASAGAAELAASYAPELNLKGAFAGAPPADLLEVTDTVDGSLGGGAVVGFALNGVIARDPDLAALIDGYFNDAGREFLAETGDSCVITTDSDPGAFTSGEDPLEAMRFDSRELTRDGRSFHEIIVQDSRLRDVLLGPDYRLGNRSPSVPVFILGGVNDDVIPYGQTRQLAADYCAAGPTAAPVTFVTDGTPGVLPGVGLGHVIPQVRHAADVLSWLSDRFNGVDAPNDCGTF